jgi:hypothetical protein
MGNGRSGKLLKKGGKDIHCRSENPRVGSSILPPATIISTFISPVLLSASNLIQLNCRAVNCLHSHAICGLVNNTGTASAIRCSEWLIRQRHLGCLGLTSVPVQHGLRIAVGLCPAFEDQLASSLVSKVVIQVITHTAVTAVSGVLFIYLDGYSSQAGHHL